MTTPAETSTTPPSELVHFYEPRGTQRQLWHDHAGELVMAGPAGTGKTRACLEYVHDCALNHPGARMILIRKTLESMKASALVTWQEEVLDEALTIGEVVPFGGNRFTQAQFAYRNGSVVLVGGMDKPGKVMSAQYDLIYVNEATELDEVDWESLLTRKRHGRMPWQQLIADCNPAEQTHWLKLRADAGLSRMYHTRHQENPLYFEADGTPTDLGRSYVLGTLANLSGLMKARMFDGLWVAAEGVIYVEFDPAVHIVDRFDVPPDWPRYWAIDFGFAHPFVWQEWAEDHDGRLWLVHEIYMTGRTVEDHCRTIKRVTNGQPRPQKIVVDHQRQEREIFEREMRMRTTLAKKDVLPGINAFQQRLKARRLFFMRDSLVERDEKLMLLKEPYTTEQELPGYVWLDKDAPKEGPVKRRDHGCDAGRYLVAELDLRPRL